MTDTATPDIKQECQEIVRNIKRDFKSIGVQVKCRSSSQYDGMRAIDVETPLIIVETVSDLDIDDRLNRLADSYSRTQGHLGIRVSPWIKSFPQAVVDKMDKMNLTYRTPLPPCRTVSAAAIDLDALSTLEAARGLTGDLPPSTWPDRWPAPVEEAAE